MSWVQTRGGREGRRQRREEEEEEEEKEGGGGGGGGGLDSYCDGAMNQMTHRPSGKLLKHRLDVPHQQQMSPGTGPRSPVPAQQMLPHPPPRDSSLGWQEERRLPPQRNRSPGWQKERRLPPQRNSSPGSQERRPLPLQRSSPPGWQEERPLADSDTLPARCRNAQPAKKETRDINLGHQGAKVHFQRPAECRQRTPEHDDQEEESGSSSANSLGKSMLKVGEGESSPDDRNLSLSYIFNVIEHEGGGSGDEDGFVHVSRGSPCGSPRGRPRGRR